MLVFLKKKKRGWNSKLKVILYISCLIGQNGVKYIADEGAKTSNWDCYNVKKCLNELSKYC